MKISELEAKIRGGDCSDETLELFKAALKRVPKSSRCQHCFTTAVEMPKRLYHQAIALIRYGLEQHCDSWSDRMRSFHNMATLLEANQDHVGALQAYREALASVDPGRRADYDPEYAAHMLRMELHISGFTYTEDLEAYYNRAIGADSFTQAFQKKQFYRLLAEILIFSRHNDPASAQRAFAKANEMLRPGHMGPLTQLLKKHHFLESTGATKEALAFLRSAKRSF